MAGMQRYGLPNPTEGAVLIGDIDVTKGNVGVSKIDPSKIQNPVLRYILEKKTYDIGCGKMMNCISDPGGDYPGVQH